MAQRIGSGPNLANSWRTLPLSHIQVNPACPYYTVQCGSVTINIFYSKAHMVISFFLVGFDSFIASIRPINNIEATVVCQ